jgi:hypothetical protein
MYGNRLAVIALIVLLHASCVGPSRENLLDAMVGEDVDYAVEAFGQPADVIDVGQGRQAYVWRRVYNYDVNRRADSWPERRLAGWTEDKDKPTKARVCSTRLVVGFDFIVQSWNYGCETVIEKRGPGPSQDDPITEM